MRRSWRKRPKRGNVTDDEKFCRAATKADLKLLLKSLAENGVDYLLIGGYALFAHGYERATTDIDILVPATLESGERVIKALMVLPDQVARDIDREWFVDVDSDEHGTIRVADEFIVDVMFNACGETYETLSQFAESIDFDGVPLRTLNLEGLLRTKQTVRDKDRADRSILERALALYQTHRPSLRDEWNAIPATGDGFGVIKAMSDSEVIQHIGQGRHVVWDRQKLSGAIPVVGEEVSISADGKVTIELPGPEWDRGNSCRM